METEGEGDRHERNGSGVGGALQQLGSLDLCALQGKSGEDDARIAAIITITTVIINYKSQMHKQHNHPYLLWMSSPRALDTVIQEPASAERDPAKREMCE